MSKALARLKQSEILRQMALDYINANPGVIAPDVIQHYGWNDASGSSRLFQMVEEKELRREPATMLCANGRQKKTFAYFALVARTKTAEDVFSRLGHKTAKSKQPVDNKWVNGCWKNNPETKEMYQNQGGQGRSGPRMATYLEVMA